MNQLSRTFSYQIQDIYSHMGNEYSRRMFSNRLLYSLTGDMYYIKQVIETTSEGKEFLSKIYNDKRKIIFSAGAWGAKL